MRPFSQAMRDSMHYTDAAVLGLVATQMGVAFNASDVAGLRAELAALGPWSGHRFQPPHAPAQTGVARTRLATWRWLVDNGTLQEGEPYLAATGRQVVATVSATTASALGSPAEVTVSGPRGSVTVPLEVGDVIDDVVVLPMNSPGCAVLRDLGAGYGAGVEIRAGGAA